MSSNLLLFLISSKNVEITPSTGFAVYLFSAQLVSTIALVSRVLVSSLIFEALRTYIYVVLQSTCYKMVEFCVETVLSLIYAWSGYRYYSVC